MLLKKMDIKTDVHGIGLDSYESDEESLMMEVQEIRTMRADLGLDSLTGDLESLVINVEVENFEPAIQEILDFTGYDIHEAFRTTQFLTCVLIARNSADIIVRARIGGQNPFGNIETGPASDDMPNTRIETLVFEARNLEKYFEIQKQRRVGFMTDEIIETDLYYFVQTKPSMYTGLSTGFIEWKERTSYKVPGSEQIELNVSKPDRPYLHNIGKLENLSVNNEAQKRDCAILEFMNLTGYDFEKALHVKSMNSIVSIAKLEDADFSMIFTSGTAPFVNREESGPVEKFVHNYGPRPHHITFHTGNIDQVYASLEGDGMELKTGLIGSKDEGVKHFFSQPSEYTMIVNEYALRFDGYEEFFRKSDAEILTQPDS